MPKHTAKKQTVYSYLIQIAQRQSIVDNLCGLTDNACIPIFLINIYMYSTTIYIYIVVICYRNVIKLLNYDKNRIL